MNNVSTAVETLSYSWFDCVLLKMALLSSSRAPNLAAESAAVILSVLLLPLSPLIALLSALILLYREVVLRVAKWADPSLGEILPPGSAIHAADRPNSNPSCLIIMSYYLSRRLDEPTLISGFQERILSKGLYPELRQRVVIKFGFHFWKREKCFKISDHIRSYVDHEGNNQSGPVNGRQLKKIMEKLLAAPFQAGRSPWEILLLPQFEDEAKPGVRSVLILRTHHCLADGLSTHCLLSKLCATPPVLPPIPKLPKLSVLAKVAGFLAFIPSLYHEFLIMYLDQDRNYWSKKRVTAARGSYKLGEFDVPSVELLKSMKRRHKVSMTALINTLFLSGFVKLAKSKGKMIPRGFLSLPLPLPGHPDQLTNHYTACHLPVKLSDDDDSSTGLLKSVDASIRSLTRLPSSVQLAAYPLLERVNGSLPLWLMRNASNIPPSTFVLSNMAGPLEQGDLFGCPVEEVSLAMKPPKTMSFICLCQSYNGSFRYSVFADEAIFEQDEDLEVFLGGMKEAFEQLSSAS